MHICVLSLQDKLFSPSVRCIKKTKQSLTAIYFYPPGFQRCDVSSFPDSSAACIAPGGNIGVNIPHEFSNVKYGRLFEKDSPRTLPDMLAFCSLEILPTIYYILSIFVLKMHQFSLDRS